MEPDLKIFIAEDKCTNADALLLLCAGVLRWGRRRLLCVGQPDLKITEKLNSTEVQILTPEELRRRVTLGPQALVVCRAAGSQDHREVYELGYVNIVRATTCGDCAACRYELKASYSLHTSSLRPHTLVA